MIPIFKNMVDVQSCSNYGGVTVDQSHHEAMRKNS